jgi:peptidoglycan hydrolase CwlO-like protein
VIGSNTRVSSIVSFSFSTSLVSDSISETSSRAKQLTFDNESLTKEVEKLKETIDDTRVFEPITDVETDTSGLFQATPNFSHLFSNSRNF